MKKIYLYPNHEDFYSPVNGERILGKDKPVNHKAKTLIAYWISEIPGEPYIKRKYKSTLGARWKEFIKNTIGDDIADSSDVENFIKLYNDDDLVCFCITSEGGTGGCGPQGGMTVWYIIKINK